MTLLVDQSYRTIINDDVDNKNNSQCGSHLHEIWRDSDINSFTYVRIIIHTDTADSKRPTKKNEKKKIQGRKPFDTQKVAKAIETKIRQDQSYTTTEQT